MTGVSPRTQESLGQVPAPHVDILVQVLATLLQDSHSVPVNIQNMMEPFYKYF